MSTWMKVGDWFSKWSESSSSSEGSGSDSASDQSEQDAETEVPACTVSNPHVPETFINVSS